MSKVDDGNIRTFQYKSKDFILSVAASNKADSPFDILLTRKWQESQENGVCRYILNVKKQKILEGTYGFLAQLNLDRGENRRMPEDISSMSKPYEPNAFNFTKILNQEILFDVGNTNGLDIVATNISPIEHCHSLIITERFKCRPQRITKYSLKIAIDLLLLSNSPYLRTIFNSLCAHASVNHLHWHLYYLEHHMPLECITVEHLQGPVFALMDFPAKGFCLKLSSFPDHNLDRFISWTYSIVNYLQESNVAHNVYITRAKEKVQSNIFDDIRIYIWARKSSSGVKSTSDFIPAVCELFGHLSIKSKQGYDDLTEDAVAEILSDITSDSFYAVRDDLLRMRYDENGIVMD